MVRKSLPREQRIRKIAPLGQVQRRAVVEKIIKERLWEIHDPKKNKEDERPYQWPKERRRLRRSLYAFFCRGSLRVRSGWRNLAVHARRFSGQNWRTNSITIIWPKSLGGIDLSIVCKKHLMCHRTTKNRTAGPRIRRCRFLRQVVFSSHGGESAPFFSGPKIVDGNDIRPLCVSLSEKSCLL